MDITNTTTDDQELAKVLESMNEQAGTPAPQADTTAAPATDDAGTMPAPVAPVDDQPAPAFDAPALQEEPVVAPEPVQAPEEGAAPAAEPDMPPYLQDQPAPAYDAPQPDVAHDAHADHDGAATPHASPELENIKRTALEELRPLVDKLDLPADERFDTLLLLIRSTDDQSLVSAAHEAAAGIEDETKRAQALLDVIKEIDYFAGQTPQQ